MIYLLLVLTAAATTSQNIFHRKFNDNCSSGTLLFTSMVSLFAMAFFIAMNREWTFSYAILPYSFLFATSYLFATVGLVLAIRYGSLAKTSMVVGFALLLPTAYGLLFLHEKMSPFGIIGLFLCIVSIVFVNRQQEDSQTPFSWKWVIFVLISFLGNGLCMISQKSKQVNIGETGNNLFMIIALFIVFFVLFVITFLFKSERKNVAKTIQKGWYWALPCGIANGLVNFLVIYLNGYIPASVLFPVHSGLGMIFIFLYSIFVRKERFHIVQYIGFGVGLVSIVLLNL